VKKGRLNLTAEGKQSSSKSRVSCPNFQFICHQRKNALTTGLLVPGKVRFTSRWSGRCPAVCCHRPTGGLSALTSPSISLVGVGPSMSLPSYKFMRGTSEQKFGQPTTTEALKTKTPLEGTEKRAYITTMV